MSLATVERDRAHISPRQSTNSDQSAVAEGGNAAPLGVKIRAVPEGPEARGFVLYVGIDEDKSRAAGIDLVTLVSELRALTLRLAPASETHAAVAFAPRGAGGRDVEVVRLALQDPEALARQRRVEPRVQNVREGVIVDLSRKRALIDDSIVPLTFKEFELLQYLVQRPGCTVPRCELVDALWGVDDADVPNERTIDVHIRRMRAKLSGYEDIVRTVRGFGYRFDQHADVSVRHASTPSPDF